MDEQTIIKYMKKKRYIDGEYICWDFVMEICKDLYNIDLPEYPVTEVQAEFKNKMLSNFKHLVIPKGEVKEGDIVVFSLFSEQHAGVMVDTQRFIHLGRTGVKITDLSFLPNNYKIYRVIKND